MAGKMEMSLDDIIKQSKVGKRSGGGGGGGAGGGRAGRRGGNKPGSPRKPGGGVLRGQKFGGIARRGDSNRPRNIKRDAFTSSAGRNKFASEATKLIVSNLDFGVTDSDILELFSEFGPIKSAGVHYDRSGRSLGSADVIYERRADGIKAMKQYNGVPLDGREMNIQLATSEIPGVSPVRSSGGGGGGGFKGRSNKPSGASKRKAKRAGGGGGGGGNKPGGGRQAKKLPTAEELDAELEEYAKSKVASTNGA